MYLPKTSTNLHLYQHLQLPQSQSYSELKTQYNHKNKISNLFYELNPKYSPIYQVKLAKEKMKYSLILVICKFLLIVVVCLSFLCYLCMLYKEDYVGNKFYNSKN